MYNLFRSLKIKQSSSEGHYMNQNTPLICFFYWHNMNAYKTLCHPLMFSPLPSPCKNFKAYFVSETSNHVLDIAKYVKCILSCTFVKQQFQKLFGQTNNGVDLLGYMGENIQSHDKKAMWAIINVTFSKDFMHEIFPLKKKLV